MKDLKKGFYLLLLSMSIIVGLLASNALDVGDAQLAKQILITWVAVIGGVVLFIGGFLFAFLRK